jgi:hypothetical protein
MTKPSTHGIKIKIVYSKRTVCNRHNETRKGQNFKMFEKNGWVIHKRNLDVPDFDMDMSYTRMVLTVRCKILHCKM